MNNREMLTGCGLISGYTASDTYLDIPRADIGIYRQIGGICESRKLDKTRGTDGYYGRFFEEMREFNLGIYCR